MSRQVKSLPTSRLLLLALRSVGYSEETAIADIVDNCISAEATSIDIKFVWNDANSKILIVDNGNGMDADSLIKNMRIGSADPTQVRPSHDLGRFGLGMKTASFSLGKKLTVITKKNGVYSNASWNLDDISDSNTSPEDDWNLTVYDDSEIDCYYPLLNTQGTIVIIESLDRLVDISNLKKSKDRFYKTISKIEKHISLIFHRFIEDGIFFSVNENLVSAWDPFITSNRATQELSEEYIESPDGNHDVLIQPYILPHKTKFPNSREYDDAGGIKGWNYHQGFYVYRNRRLIIFGTWFDIVKKEPAYNLARIRIDISSDSDELWNIDIKKSVATLPIYVKDTINRVIESTTEASAKVYNSRGTYTKNVTIPNLSYVWEQRKINGKYSFHINQKHSLLKSIREQLSQSGKDSLAAYLSLIENFAPFMLSGITTSLESKNKQPEIDSLEYKEKLCELQKCHEAFIAQGFTKEEIRTTLLEMPYFNSLKQVIIEMTEA